MKFTFTAVLLFCFTASFSQWTRVVDIPVTNVFSLYRHDTTLYAGTKNKIYFSKDKGQHWDSTSAIPAFTLVSSIIIYKDELYAGSFGQGIVKSANGGVTWQNISAGVFPDISEFCEFHGDLFVSTLGNSMFKIDTVRLDRWIFFSAGLSNNSANANALTSTKKALIAGTIGNGLYDQLFENSNTWEERFLLGQIKPTEKANDLLSARDTLYFAGSTGTVYMSTNNGTDWSIIGGPVGRANNSSVANAKEALLLGRTLADNNGINTFFYYLKKDVLLDPFVNFSFVPNHFTFKVEVFANKFWDASATGLFFMSLSDLPGITEDDSVIHTTLPVLFSLFNTRCDGANVVLSWKTAQEQNSSLFHVQRSIDGVNWTTLGDVPASGNSATEKSYSFTVNNPLPNNFYRIIEVDIDGKLQFTAILRANCSPLSNSFELHPNPVRDVLTVNITSTNQSPANMRLFDSKGALVKVQKTTLLQGNNQLTMDVSTLAKGIYTLKTEWGNGQMIKTVQILKQ